MTSQPDLRFPDVRLSVAKQLAERAGVRPSKALRYLEGRVRGRAGRMIGAAALELGWYHLSNPYILTWSRD